MGVVWTLVFTLLGSTYYVLWDKASLHTRARSVVQLTIVALTTLALTFAVSSFAAPYPCNNSYPVGVA